MKLKDVCEKCVHKKECTRPCRPVELHLADGNQGVFEKRHIDPTTGRQVTVLYPTREQRESSMVQEFADTGIPADKIQRTFSTSAESPFRHFSADLKQTGIFIDRFFHKFTYEDLAVKYDLSQADTRELYRRAVQRVFSILHELDARSSRKRVATNLSKQPGELSSPQRWFIMARVMGMGAAEIAEFDGVKSNLVRNQLQRITNQLAAGEKDLIEFTPGERRKAKAHLDKIRAKRRERHARKGTKKRSQ